MKIGKFALLAVLAMPVSVYASFSDCAKFSGNYVSLDTRNTNLEISSDASHLILAYDQGSGIPEEGYTVAFIADGLEHPGTDANTTGTSYTASCSPDGITLVRDGMFIAPYTSQYTVNNGVLVEVGTVQGFSSQQMGEYKLTSQ